MSLHILPLNSPEATLALAGGKGANLADMLRAGFPVPPGFLITMEAYHAFVEANQLQTRIIALAAQGAADDGRTLEDASAQIRALFDRAQFPPEISEGIAVAYRELSQESVEMSGYDAHTPPRPHPHTPTPPLAVRSSAMLEDRAEASAAGQHATLLNVRGEAALLQAVRRCWSSLWSGQAIAYRARRRSDGTLPQMAVVVQRMIPADCAGVLFTVNPVNRNGDEILINAAWGFGEGVVAGRVTPDTLTVDKATGRVKRLGIGDKAVMIVPTEKGTAEVPVEPHRRRQPALDAEQVIELVRLAREVEAHFRVPQDIEWAVARGRVYLLQARPLTAFPPSPCGRGAEGESEVPGDDRWPAVDERPPQPYDLWTRAILGEVWPNPVSPLMWSGVPVIIGESIRYALRGLKTPYLENGQLAGRFYGRVYYNEGALAIAFSRELGLPGSFVNAALGSRRGVDHERDGRFRPVPFVRRLPFLVRMAMSQLGTGKELENLFPQIDRWVREFREEDLRRLSDRGLWDELMCWVKRFRRVISLQAEISSIGITAFALLEGLMARWFGRKELAMDLIAGLPGVFAAEMGPALWCIAQTLRELGLADLLLENDPEVAHSRLREIPAAQSAMRLMDSFIERHGHRCPNEGEWLNPRWAEAPPQLVEVIAGYLRASDGVDLKAAQARQHERREEATAWAEARLDPVRRALFRRVLGRAQHGARLRDNGKHYYMKLALPVRRIDVQLGRRWSERGWLEQPEDIFFLTIPDILRVIEAGDPLAAGLDLRKRVVERRRAFEYWFTVEAPEVIGPSGTPMASGRESGPRDSILHGIPASGGRARGTARIVVDPREGARLSPGDILVTRATDPGWTPLFPLVSGLVIEVGGQLSHAAIVAREYGVPTVVSVHDAMRRIREGQTIVVDGTAGCVHLVSDGGSAGDL